MSTDLPPDWEIRETKQYPGRCYFYNKRTGVSQWSKPNSKITNYYVAFLCHAVSRPGERETITEEMKNVKDRVRRRLIQFGKPATGDYCFKESWFSLNHFEASIEDSILKLAVGEISEPLFSNGTIYMFLRKA